MNKRRFVTTTLVMLAVALSFVCSTVRLTGDVPLIISPGTDGIATVTAEYNVSIAPPVVVDANTTFTDVVRLVCPAGYTDQIGIANLTLNPNQIKEFQIFVTYSDQKIMLIHYQNGSIIQNNTFTLYPETEAIMGISIIPTPIVINAGPIDPIYYNIVCSYGAPLAPVANFTVSPDPPYYAPATLTFNASASTPNGGTIISYAWDFGDSTEDTGMILNHTYTAADTYTVTLNVTDSEGLWNTTTTILTVDSCDVSVTNVVPSVDQAYQLWTIQVNVTVHNNGTVPINATVTAYYYNASAWYEIGTQPITDLAPCNTTTLTFNWGLQGLTPCNNYTVKANVTCTCDATSASDEFVNGQVKIRLIGDVSGDGKVTGLDQILVGMALFAKPGDPMWIPQADFNGDGKITGLDQILVGMFLFEKCP